MKSASPRVIMRQGPKQASAATARWPRVLLVFGILSSVFYIAANVIASLRYPGYDWTSQAVSELSAIDAPTREIWGLMMIPYALLTVAFGIGVVLTARRSRALTVCGIAIICQTVSGAFWPPMHRREVLAAGGATMTDTLHIVFTVIWGIFALTALVSGAIGMGKGFRLYTLATTAVLLGFGVLTSLQAPDMQANLPTPMMGVWERINMGVFFLWVIALAAALLSGEADKTVEPTT